jgi:hypothetical protein
VMHVQVNIFSHNIIKKWNNLSYHIGALNKRLTYDSKYLSYPDSLS